MADEQSGIVFKSNDGDTYFIRSEILDACKVQPGEQEVTDQMVEEQTDEVGGFGFSFAQPVSYSFKSSISIAPNRFRDSRDAASRGTSSSFPRMAEKSPPRMPKPGTRTLRP